MSVERQDTADLQLLIETLQINPNLISVDMVEYSNDDVARSSGTEDENVAKHKKENNYENQLNVKSSGVKRSIAQESDPEEKKCFQSKKVKCGTKK